MPDHGPAFGGGAVASVLSPIVLVGLIVAIVLVLFLPRKFVIVNHGFVVDFSDATWAANVRGRGALAG